MWTRYTNDNYSQSPSSHSISMTPYPSTSRINFKKFISPPRETHESGYCICGLPSTQHPRFVQNWLLSNRVYYASQPYRAIHLLFWYEISYSHRHVRCTQILFYRTQMSSSLLITLKPDDVHTHQWTILSLFLVSGLTSFWYQAILWTDTDWLSPGPLWIMET